jgi:hypothetical protein
VSDRLLSAIEIASAAAITIGATTVSSAAGWVTAGLLGLLFAWRAAQ